MNSWHTRVSSGKFSARLVDKLPAREGFKDVNRHWSTSRSLRQQGPRKLLAVIKCVLTEDCEDGDHQVSGEKTVKDVVAMEEVLLVLVVVVPPGVCSIIGRVVPAPLFSVHLRTKKRWGSTLINGRSTLTSDTRDANLLQHSTPGEKQQCRHSLNLHHHALFSLSL